MFKKKKILAKGKRARRGSGDVFVEDESVPGMKKIIENDAVTIDNDDSNPVTNPDPSPKWKGFRGHRKGGMVGQIARLKNSKYLSDQEHQVDEIISGDMVEEYQHMITNDELGDDDVAETELEASKSSGLYTGPGLNLDNLGNSTTSSTRTIQVPTSESKLLDKQIDADIYDFELDPNRNDSDDDLALNAKFTVLSLEDQMQALNTEIGQLQAAKQAKLDRLRELSQDLTTAKSQTEMLIGKLYAVVENKQQQQEQQQQEQQHKQQQEQQHKQQLSSNLNTV